MNLRYLIPMACAALFGCSEGAEIAMQDAGRSGSNFVPPPINTPNAMADAGGGGTGFPPGGPGRPVGDAGPAEPRPEACDPSQAEACDDFDNDCDTRVDEGCPCAVAEKQCYTGNPQDLESPLSACRMGVQACRLESYGECTGQVLPQDEVCDGLDNDCDAFIDELDDCGSNTPPEAVCPPDQFGPPLATYDFVGQYRDGDGDQMRRAEWRFLEQPVGSTSRVNPALGLQTQIFADLQGQYILEFEVEDVRGGIGRCTTRLNTQTYDDLRIEMVWNVNAVNDRSDVDLHLARAPNASWFDGDSDGDDCFYVNCKVCDSYDEDECREQIAAYNATPDMPPPAQVMWSAPLDNDDPRLDLDDVDGQGPENLNINRPSNGTYRLGIHYWDDDGFGASTVSVRIFCNGEEAAAFGPLVLQPAGSSGGPNTEFWEVADIEWTNNACRVVPLGVNNCPRICTRAQAEAGGCPVNQSRGSACR
jgi:hypothetical protein